MAANRNNDQFIPMMDRGGRLFRQTFGPVLIEHIEEGGSGRSSFAIAVGAFSEAAGLLEKMTRSVSPQMVRETEELMLASVRGIMRGGSVPINEDGTQFTPTWLYN